jgi:hypothetical protein
MHYPQHLTLTDLLMLLSLRADGRSVDQYGLSSTRFWYALTAGLLLEGILRGEVEFYKQEQTAKKTADEKKYDYCVRIANNRHRTLSSTFSYPPDTFVEQCLWLLRKQSQPYHVSSFITGIIGSGNGITYPISKLKKSLVEKGVLSQEKRKIFFGLFSKTFYQVKDVEFHTTLLNSIQGLLGGTHTQPPTMRDIFLLILLRVSHLLPHIYSLSPPDTTKDEVVKERIAILMTEVQTDIRNRYIQHKSDDSHVPPIIDDIFLHVFLQEEYHEDMMMALDILMDALMMTIDLVSEATDASMGSDGADGGADGGGDGGGGD